MRRTDLLAQAGFTADDFNDITWEEFIEKGKVVRQATGLPMLKFIAGGGDCPIIMLYSAGAALFHEDGSVFIEDNEILRQCMEIYATMVREGILEEVVDWNQYIGALNNGTVVSVMNGGSSWVISSSCKNPELAIDFLKSASRGKRGVL